MGLFGWPAIDDNKEKCFEDFKSIVVAQLDEQFELESGAYHVLL